MLNVANNINEAWLSPSRQLEARITMNGEVYDNSSITSFSFDSGSISGESFQIGSAYMNQVQIVFPSVISTVAEDQELTVEVGILVDDVYHYTKLGKFIISEFDRNQNDKTTTVTAVDQMIFLEGPYVSKITYPARIRDVALEIANLAGVEIDQPSFSTLPTTTIKKPEGYTYRQAIGLIAQFEGGFANFNRDGKLQVRRLAPTAFTITPDNYLLKGFTKNETTYRPNGIVVRTGDEESDVLRVGSNSGNIIELENKVMTQTLLNSIWNRVKDISYFPYEVKWQGNPNLEAGDWFYIVDREGNRYSVPNLSFSFNYNGGMSAESKATTTSNSEVTYRYRGSLKQQIEEIKGVLEGANGWNSNYYDSETEPPNPKIGDLWFKKNGADNEIWIYRLVDGVAKWELEISSAPNQELLDAIQEAIDASNAAKQAGEDAKEAGERAEQLGNEAKQAGEEAKQAGEEAKAEAELARQAGEDAKAAGQRAESLAGQAKAESATAINNANNAVSKANQAVEDAGFSKTQAQDAQQLADEAKQDALNAISQAGTAKQIAESASSAVSGAVNTANQAKQDALNAIGQAGTAKQIAESASSAVSGAVNTANQAKQDALNAIGQAGTAVTDAKAALDAYDNLELGARNLYTGTKDFSGNWHNLSHWSEDGEYNGFKVLRRTGQWNGLSQPHPVTESGTYTLSAWVKNGDKGDVRFYGSYITVSNVAIGTFSEWTRVSVTFKTPGTGQWNGRFENSIPDGTIYICGFKLEKGNKATDWTPAPEDVQVQISTINGELSQKVSQTAFNTLQGTVSSQGTQINQNKSDITLKANQSTVNTLTGRVSTAEGSITANANAITQRATKTEVNTLTGRVSTAEGQISTQAEQISQRLTATQVDQLVNGKGYATQTSVNSQVSTINGKINEHTSQLQTVTSKVDNITVGQRNFLRGTSSEWTSYNFKEWQDKPNQIYTLDELGLKVGDTLYLSTEINAISGQRVCMQLTWVNSNGTTSYATGNYIDIGETGVSNVLAKIPAGTTQIALKHIVKLDGTTLSTGKYRLNGVYKSTVPVDWTPAPEDSIAEITAATNTLNQRISDNEVLTQSKLNLTQVKAEIDSRGYETKSRVNSIENTLTQRISSNETETASKLSRTQVESLITGKGYATTTQLNNQVSTINGQLNSHTSQLQTVTATVDGITTTQRNYLRDTSSEWTNFDFTGWSLGQQAYPIEALGLKAGDSIFISGEYEVTSGTGVRIQINFTTPSGTVYFGSNPIISPNEKGVTSTFVTIPAGAIGFGMNIVQSMDGTTRTVGRHRLTGVYKSTVPVEWTPAPEDTATVAEVTSKTNAINQRITDTENSITAVVNTTTTQGNKISSLESKVTVAEGNITAANTKVTSNATQIGTLQSGFSGLQSTVSNVQNKLNSLEYGASNLFNDSRGQKTWHGVTVSNLSQVQVDEPTSPYGKAKKATMTASNTGGLHYAPIKLTVGKVYSWSVYIKANVPGRMFVGSEQGGQKYCDVTTSWQKFTHTFTCVDSQYSSFTFYRISGNISETYIHSPVLVEGNVIPNWTESINDQITVTEFSDFKQTVEGFTTTVNNSITGLTTQQSTMSGQITSLITQTKDIVNLFKDPTFTTITHDGTDGSGWTTNNTSGAGRVWTNTTGTRSSFYFNSPSKSILLEAGKYYSIKVKVNSGASIWDLEIGTYGGENIVEKMDGSTKWVTGTIKTDINVALRFWIPNNQSFRIHELYVYETATGITTTSINSLKSTVDGTTQTIANMQTDLNGKATVTALNSVKNTVDSHTQTISSHNGRITTAQQTADGAKTTATDAQGRVATVEQKVTGLQTTVADKADKSQITQLAGEIASVVSSVDEITAGNPNLLRRNNEVQGSMISSDGQPAALITSARSAYPITVTAGEKLTFSQYRTNPSADNYFRYAFDNNSGTVVLREANNTVEFTVTVPSGATRLRVSYHADNMVKIERGSKKTVWAPAPEDTATQSQITQLASDINLRVTKADLIGEINVSAGKTIIRQSDNVVMITPTTTYIQDATIKNAHIADLAVTNAKIGNLSVNEGKIANAAITTLKVADAAISNAKIANLAVDGAKIASLAVDTGHIKDLAVSNAKIANLAVSNAKLADAAITSAKIGDAAIVNAKIANGAINDAKIQDASISSAKIISLDANKISANDLRSISSQTGALEVTGWLDFSSDNRGVRGSYNFGDDYIGAYNSRWFDGDFRMSHRYLMFKSQVYDVTSNNTRGAYRYHTESFYGPDYFKLRQYSNSSMSTLLNHVDITADAIIIGDRDWATRAIINADGSAMFNGRVSFNSGIDIGAPDNIGLSVGRINAPSNYSSLTINQNRALADVVFGEQNIYFNETRTIAADFRIGRDGSNINGGRVVASNAIYNRTYSGAANMLITPEGVLGRSTSALKYKDDVRTANDVMSKAKKVIQLQPKSWLDKGELADGIANKRHYGFIADEFDVLGLSEVVIYGDKGQVESLAYDRISMYHNVILKEHESEIQSMKYGNFERDFEIQKLKFEIQKLNMEIESLRQTA